MASESIDRRILWCAFVLMVCGAGYRLSDEFHRLVFDQTPFGARDLYYRYLEVRPWFDGAQVYGVNRMAVYPPATFSLLWPFLGWQTWPAARLLWAATTVLATAWFVALAFRAVPRATRLERACLALMVLSAHGTGSTIGNGQLLLHLLPALAAGTLLLRLQPPSVAGDALAACAFTWAAVKPNAAAPFMLLVLMLPGRLRPAVMVTVAYSVLTLASLWFREEGAAALMRSWLAQLDGVDVFGGYGDVHSWLILAGLPQWRLRASGLIIALFALWLWRHRDADPWNLLGIAAIVARTFAYHRPYDDGLLLLPMIALARIVSAGGNPAAARLLAAVWLGALAPVYFLLHYGPSSLPGLFHLYQVAAWLATLGYLATRMPPREGVSV